MDLINTLIDSYNLPVLTAFLLGILTSISPCPLATNITAIAFISKDIKTPKHTLLNGLLYTLGRGLSYTLVAVLIYVGLSSFQIAGLFQGWGDKVLGPILILLGLIMLGWIKLPVTSNNESIETLKAWFASKGYLGSLLLGMLFALAFCPYSGVLFFGALMPLVMKSPEALLLPPLFALGTGIPVIIFSFLIAFSMHKLAKAFSLVSRIEKIIRYAVAIIFIAAGLYYLQFLVRHLNVQTTSPKLGYCPTMAPYANHLKTQLPVTLIEFSTSEAVLKNLNQDVVDLALIGRKAKPNEDTSGLQSVQIDLSATTLVKDKKSNSSPYLIPWVKIDYQSVDLVVITDNNGRKDPAYRSPFIYGSRNIDPAALAQTVDLIKEKM
jgi:cytochrome c-type biogenesis protein